MHTLQVGKILVTGSSGFVGQHLLGHLRALQIDVTGWDASIDIRDAAAVNAAVKAARPDAVIHLAAIAAPALAQSNQSEAWNVNVLGTLNVAQAILNHVPESTLVFVGTSESYGTSFNASDKPIMEDAALAPANAYGATKAAADLMIGQLARDGLRAVRLRPFNHTGPGQDDTYVISNFARQIAAIEANGGKGILHVGNLDARRDFLDVRDVIRAYVACCTTKITPGTAINISTGKPIAIRDALDALVAASTATIEIETDSKRLRPLEIATASGDPSRALALIGWKPDIALSQTLKDVLDYWRGRIGSSDRQ